MSRKIVLDLTDETFAYLELLAFGLHLEDKAELNFNGTKNDFAPMVNTLLIDVADSLAAGVRRTGSHERQTVDQLTGWDGTYNIGMVADCIKADVKNWKK